MSLRQTVYGGGNRKVIRRIGDESDQEEDALVEDYQAQLQNESDFEDDHNGPLETVSADLKAQFQAAVKPLASQASLPMKFQSFNSYCHLFHEILNSEQPVDLELPNHYWAWEVIDEFIYQFNAFSAYRQKIVFKNENKEEIQELKDNHDTWACYNVLNILYSLIKKSNIQTQLAAIKRGEDPNQYADEYGSRQLYKSLGYFSIIGLLRVQCLLGDFSLALKTLDAIELSKKATFARVMAAHMATYYYAGFSYMMMRRYADAIRMFSHILVYVYRTKNFQKNSQFDNIGKKTDHMLALIAICNAFHPTRLDDTIHNAVKEKFGDQSHKMLRGGEESLPVFEELFRMACPKFISPSAPDFDNPEVNVDPIDHHCRIFMDEVKANMWSPTVKSYLRLYTSMDTSKLAGFLDVDGDTLRSWLLVNKQRSRQIRWSEGSLLEGDTVNGSELDYALDGDLINVSESKVGRRLVDWYLRNLTRTY